MKNDMGEPERVQVARREVPLGFFDSVRSVAEYGLAFAGQTWGKSPKAMKRQVDAAYREIGSGMPEHLAIALRAAFLNAWSSEVLAIMGVDAPFKRRERATYYGIRAQRYMAKTFCLFAQDDAGRYLATAAVTVRARRTLIGAMTLAVVARTLVQRIDVTVWFPSSREDMYGVDLVAVNAETGRAACMQVKTARIALQTCAVMDSSTAGTIGGQVLEEKFLRWRKRCNAFIATYPQAEWILCFVLANAERPDELPVLHVIADILANPRPTAHS